MGSIPIGPPGPPQSAAARLVRDPARRGPPDLTRPDRVLIRILSRGVHSGG